MNCRLQVMNGTEVIVRVHRFWKLRLFLFLQTSRAALDFGDLKTKSDVVYASYDVLTRQSRNISHCERLSTSSSLWSALDLKFFLFCSTDCLDCDEQYVCGVSMTSSVLRNCIWKFWDSNCRSIAYTSRCSSFINQYCLPANAIAEESSSLILTKHRIIVFI